MSTTFQLLQQLLAKKQALDPQTISPESALESLGLDSLDVIETLFDVEDRFHIRIPQDLGRESNMKTVNDIVAIIDRLTKEQNSSRDNSNRPISKSLGD